MIYSLLIPSPLWIACSIEWILRKTYRGISLTMDDLISRLSDLQTRVEALMERL
jgi:hypothetical protein